MITTSANIDAFIKVIGERKIQVTREGVRLFNAQWPASTLRATRAYWFEFDTSGDLIDTDVPEHDDGDAAKAMCEDCQAWLFDDIQPDWI